MCDPFGLSLATLPNMATSHPVLLLALFLSVAGCTDSSNTADADDTSASGGADGDKSSGGSKASSGGSDSETSSGGAGGEVSHGGAGGASLDASALCMNAGSADECTATSLPTLEDGVDCWHDCVWLTTHEVELTDGVCSYGETKSRCQYRTGGEGEDVSLSESCRSFGETFGGGLVQSNADGIYLGYLSEGGIQDADPCSGSNPPPECACLCLPGYPDAECEDKEQAFGTGTDSGVEECPGVPAHRVRAETCTENVGECETDDDCTSGDACLCAHVGGMAPESQCVSGSCSTSDDCADDEVCAVVYSGADDTCRATSLACQESYEKCGGEQCDVVEICGYNEDVQAFECQDAQACY